MPYRTLIILQAILLISGMSPMLDEVEDICRAGPDYLIDTNSFIDYLDNKLPSNANQLIEGISNKISVITRMELLSWPGAGERQTVILNAFILGTLEYALDESEIVKAIEVRKHTKQNFPMPLSRFLVTLYYFKQS